MFDLQSTISILLSVLQMLDFAELESNGIVSLNWSVSNGLMSLSVIVIKKLVVCSAILGSIMRRSYGLITCNSSFWESYTSSIAIFEFRVTPDSICSRFGGSSQDVHSRFCNCS